MKIQNKIVSAKVVKGSKPVDKSDKLAETVPLQRKHPGEWVMPSSTYKIKSRFTRHNVYCHIIDDEGGMFAIFFNCKDSALEARLTGLSVTISAVLRRTEDPSFLIEELKSIEGPGGYIHPPRHGQVKGWYCGSIEAEVGDIIDWHLSRDDGATLPSDTPTSGAQGFTEAVLAPVADVQNTGLMCPDCRQPTLMKMAGCEECNCGYTRCGG